MRKYDVIYILAENAANYEELRYSLRSIEKNMSHGDVWFYGGNPKGFVTDRAVRLHQNGRSKWEKVRNTLFAICQDPDVPARFWLFNDDFFIMQRLNSTKAVYNKTLADHYEHVKKIHGGWTSYSRALWYCEQALKAKDLPTLDFAVHVPMLIDKEKALEVLTAFPDCPMFRSLYGNYNQVDGVHMDDVKISDPTKEVDPEAALLSTSNKTFKYGLAGKYIRAAFPDPCKYEAGQNG